MATTLKNKVYEQRVNKPKFFKVGNGKGTKTNIMLNGIVEVAPELEYCPTEQLNASFEDITIN